MAEPIQMLFKRRKKKENSDSLSDDELVKKYRQTGDLNTLGILFQRYTTLVFGVSMKYLKNEDECKDVVMQVFEKLVVSLKKHDVDNFKSWLHVLTKNHCLTLLRATKNKHFQDINAINLEKNVEFTYELHHNNEERLEKRLGQLENGIEALPEGQKQCIDLFYIQQKCYKEIVDITGFDLKKVKSYIQNGRRNLKIYLEKQ